MAAPATSLAAEQARASRRLRQVQADLRKLLADDQENPEIGFGVCEGLNRVEEQLDRLCGLQELFEWYGEMPHR